MAACASGNYEDDLQNMEVDGNISGSAPGTHSEKRMVNSLGEVSEAGKSVMFCGNHSNRSKIVSINWEI